jgi:phosphoglycerate dehydrogenase-like enzyme
MPTASAPPVTATGGTPIKIAILDDYQNTALAMADWSVLPAEVEVTVFRDHLADPEALIARLAPFAIVCPMRERTGFPREVIERLPNLRLLATTGAWNAAIDLGAAAERGVTVCGTGGVANATPELTWALILALVRGLPAELASVRAGGWQVGLGGDLRGRTLGIIGLGNIGTTIARYARAFEMEVIAWSQNLTAERAAAAGARLVGKAELFREADIATIHLVLSGRTRGLIGAADLELMKPTAFLVNTSRGPIVDEAALIEVLEGGAIAGAALDAFAEEPLPVDHPFRTLPNVLASPHIGYVSADMYRLFFGETVENIAAWLKGMPIRTITSAYTSQHYR